MGGRGPGTWRTSESLRPIGAAISLCEKDPKRDGSGGDMRLLMSKRFMESVRSEINESILGRRMPLLVVEEGEFEGRKSKAENGCNVR
jgi:hypothetical protein